MCRTSLYRSRSHTASPSIVRCVSTFEKMTRVASSPPSVSGLHLCSHPFSSSSLLYPYVSSPPLCVPLERRFEIRTPEGCDSLSLRILLPLLRVRGKIRQKPSPVAPCNFARYSTDDLLSHRPLPLRKPSLLSGSDQLRIFIGEHSHS